MTTETKRKRNYTEDFKKDAVALLTELGYKPSVAAWSLGFGWPNIHAKQEHQSTPCTTDIAVMSEITRKI